MFVVLGVLFDFFVIYVISFLSLLVVMIMNGNVGNILFVVVVMLLVCVGIGLLNGFIVIVFKVNGFIVMFGVGFIL